MFSASVMAMGRFLRLLDQIVPRGSVVHIAGHYRRGLCCAHNYSLFVSFASYFACCYIRTEGRLWLSRVSLCRNTVVTQYRKGGLRIRSCKSVRRVLCAVFQVCVLLSLRVTLTLWLCGLVIVCKLIIRLDLFL